MVEFNLTGKKLDAHELVHIKLPFNSLTNKLVLVLKHCEFPRPSHSNAIQKIRRQPKRNKIRRALNEIKSIWDEG